MARNMSAWEGVMARITDGMATRTPGMRGDAGSPCLDRGGGSKTIVCLKCQRSHWLGGARPMLLAFCPAWRMPLGRLGGRPRVPVPRRPPRRHLLVVPALGGGRPVHEAVEASGARLGVSPP